MSARIKERSNRHLEAVGKGMHVNKFDTLSNKNQKECLRLSNKILELTGCTRLSKAVLFTALTPILQSQVAQAFQTLRSHKVFCKKNTLPKDRREHHKETLK